MSEQAPRGPPGRGGHLPGPGHELVGGVRDRLGRHHPGDGHRAVRRASMGAAAIPAIALVVIIGLIVCLCMGELAAPPARTAPGACRPTPTRASNRSGTPRPSHIGGVSGWGYWLGWFPVAPINMILAAGYIAVLFHVPLGRSFSTPRLLGTPVAIGVLAITFVGLLGLFIPCYLGITPRATFATILGVVVMVPLTLLVLLPIFKPSSFHWSNISGFHYADPKTAGLHLLHGVDLRHLVERHRHGGGRLLHRRVP